MSENKLVVEITAAKIKQIVEKYYPNLAISDTEFENFVSIVVDMCVRGSEWYAAEEVFERDFGDAQFPDRTKYNAAVDRCNSTRDRKSVLEKDPRFLTVMTKAEYVGTQLQSASNDELNEKHEEIKTDFQTLNSAMDSIKHSTYVVYKDFSLGCDETSYAYKSGLKAMGEQLGLGIGKK